MVMPSQPWGLHISLHSDHDTFEDHEDHVFTQTWHLCGMDLTILCPGLLLMATCTDTAPCLCITFTLPQPKQWIGLLGLLQQSKIVAD